MMNDNNDNKFDDVYELITKYGTQAMPEAMKILFNEAMRLERENHLGASHYQRSLYREDYANGYKPKTVKTRIGELNLSIPQTRKSDFYPNCLEKGLRSEKALNIALAQMYVEGVSTRKVSNIIEEMCGFEVSSQMVSNASKKLDESLTLWRERTLSSCEYLFLDARYEKVRVGGVVVDCAVLIAIGIDKNGKREILGIEVSRSESEVFWRDFLSSLQKRGMCGVKLIISDAHSGLQAARKAVIPGVLWQRCQFHLQQNAQSYVTKQSQKSIVAEDIRTIFNAPNEIEAKRYLGLFIEKYQKTMPKLSLWAENNITEGLTIFALNLTQYNRIRLRTSNVLERLNRSIKKRTNVVKIFANEKSCLRLVSAIVMEISEQWQNEGNYLTKR